MSVNILAPYLQDKGRHTTCFLHDIIHDNILSRFIFSCTWGTLKGVMRLCVCVCVCVWFLPPTAPFTSTPTHTHYQPADVCLCVWKPDPCETDTSSSFILKHYSYWDVCECVHVHSLCVYLSLALFIKVNDWQRSSLRKRSTLNCIECALVVYLKS